MAESHFEGPLVRSSEIISSVVAALAIEQSAHGAIEAFYSKEAQGNFLLRSILGVVFILLVITVVRFFHGNAIYLQDRYWRWNGREVESGARIAMPLRHSFDVLLNLLEYSALVGAGHVLAESDNRFRSVIHWIIALFVVDVAWSVWQLFSPSPDQRSDAPELPFLRWAVTNGVTASLLAASLWAVPDGQLQYAFVGLLTVNTVVDYAWNYDHFFQQRTATTAVDIAQAKSAVQYLGMLRHFSPAKISSKEELGRILSEIFAFFMQNMENRSDLFKRPRKALLQVGLYIEFDGELIPVFRYADKKIRLKNDRYQVGLGHLGLAFAKLRNDPYEGYRYDKRERLVDADHPGGPPRRHLKYYRSSVLAGVFWPPLGRSRTALGILVVTSNLDYYFTPRVHEAILVSVGGLISQILEGTFGSIPALEVKKALIEMAKPSPFVGVADNARK